MTTMCKWDGRVAVHSAGGNHCNAHSQADDDDDDDDDDNQDDDCNADATVQYI